MRMNKIAEQLNDERLICNALRCYHRYRTEHALELMKEEDFNFNSLRLHEIQKAHENKYIKLNKMLQRKCK